jgi:hypothetical protein
MDDTVDVDFFEKALAEEGLTDVTVLQYREPANMCEVIRVRKEVNGERMGIDHQISDRELMQIDDVKQHMAMLAGRTARQFQEYVTERHEWGENSVLLDLNEDYDATCYRCGAEVSMDDLDPTAMPMAETAVPQPVTSDYRMLSNEKLRFTLLALLKGECEPFCPNSPHDPTNHRKV